MLIVYCCVVVLESCVQAICADCVGCVVVLESFVQAICADCVLLCCSIGELCSNHLC